jgi:hypothetical protein
MTLKGRFVNPKRQIFATNLVLFMECCIVYAKLFSCTLPQQGDLMYYHYILI